MRTPGTPSSHNKNALPIWFSFVKCEAQCRSHCNSHSTDAVLGSPIALLLAPLQSRESDASCKPGNCGVGDVGDPEFASRQVC